MIYTLHPKLAPFVGKHYTKVPLKVLFQGESHYLPETYDHKVGQEWYEGSTASYGFSKKV